MNQSYDDELYLLMCQAGIAFDEAEWLSDHLRIGNEERESFLNNEIENPRFVYRAQTAQAGYQERIDVLSQALKQSKVPAVVVDLYQKKLDLLLLRSNLVGASLTGNDENFFAASVGLYGQPRQKYFSYVAKRVMVLCRNQKEKHPGATRRLQKALGRVNSSDVDIDVDVLPPVIKEGVLIKSVSEVEMIFKEVLARYEIEGWSVVVDHTGNRRIFATNMQLKRIIIPSEKHLFSRSAKITDVHALALAEHEIGVHARRSFAASQTSLRLLETGFDHYLKGEEGVASYVQQQVEGAEEFYGFDRYLAAGLAVGMDGEVRDFRGVFSLMTDYYTLKFEIDGEEKHSTPYRAAWDVCVRVFRGTTGQTAGCIYTKDIVYLEGNIGIWNLLTKKPHVFPWLFVGKYNPLIKRHVNTLQTLEIMLEW